MYLSEKQLLLLDNFLYLSASAKVKEKTIEDIIAYLKIKGTNEYNEKKIDVTGGIKPAEAIEFLKEIEKDEMLMSLRIKETVDTGIRGICFTDSRNPGSNYAVIAFRGTGGIPRAWSDNILGLYQTETMMQQEAVGFIDKVCADYNIGIVTGHSKGGNLAQFVTVMSQKDIGRCVSFDGQGFSDFFIKEHINRIEKNRHKITTIASYKDPVSALLTSIAGKELFIKTKDDVKGFGNHKSITLNNDSFFDLQGNYSESILTQRSDTINKIQKVAGWLNSPHMPWLIKESIAKPAAPIIGLIMSDNKLSAFMNMPLEVAKTFMGEYETKPLDVSDFADGCYGENTREAIMEADIKELFILSEEHLKDIEKTFEVKKVLLSNNVLTTNNILSAGNKQGKNNETDNNKIKNNEADKKGKSYKEQYNTKIKYLEKQSENLKNLYNEKKDIISKMTGEEKVQAEELIKLTEENITAAEAKLAECRPDRESLESWKQEIRRVRQEKQAVGDQTTKNEKTGTIKNQREK